MSSMSAWMAMPGIQTYNSTKAFIYNFSKSIWYELKPQNVGITVSATANLRRFGAKPNKPVSTAPGAMTEIGRAHV